MPRNAIGVTKIPRNSSGQYSLPSGSYGQPNTTIESARYNSVIDDLAQDLNTPRPVVAGGTGATTAAGAMENLGGVSLSYINALFCGFIDYFPTATPPEGWLVCNGQAVSRTTYSALFDVIGTSWGVGNGTTTFNVPDLRGEFIRGADMGRGIDTGRAIGSSQSEDVKAHGHTGTTDTAGAHTHPYNVVGFTAGAQVQAGSDWAVFLAADTTTSSGSHSHTVTIGSSGGTESRPRNIALVPCIKT